MRSTLTPIMLGLIAAAIPTAMLAAERGQILIKNPAGPTQIILDDGDTVTTDVDPAMPAASIEVWGAGNSVQGNNITINTSASPSDLSWSVRAVNGGLITLSNSIINSVGGGGPGSSTILASGVNSRVIVRNGQITSHDAGPGATAINGGHVDIDGGFIETSSHNASGVSAQTSGSVLTANDVTISTQGRYSSGATALGGGDVTLTSVTITTAGNAAHGLRMDSFGLTATPTTLSATNTEIRTTGQQSHGLQIAGGASATLDNTHLRVQGVQGSGIESQLTLAGPTNTVHLANGSLVDTRDGAGIVAKGGNHTFVVSDSTLIGRTASDIDTGTLLRADVGLDASTGGPLATGQVTLDATRSTLTGDVVVNDGTVNVALKDGSVLTGAVTRPAAGTGVANGLSLDASSVWNVRGDSRLTTLNNAGTVAFMAPSGGARFKTLTVTNYVGGGTLVLNTQLGDDAAGTDRLVIDGGTTSGTTSLRILNAGGTGAQTGNGIPVVQTINGGMTATDAFRLDAGSTGYRASAGTLAVNGYEYSLVRGGNGGAAPDWYLTSDYSAIVPPGPGTSIDIDLVVPVDPSAKPAFRNVSPESGAYLGNRLASARFFSHSLRDRNAAAGTGGAVAYSGDVTGGDGSDASADSRQLATAGRGLWTRVEGRQDSGLRMAQGRVTMDTDSAILQLGGDLIKAPLGQAGAVYAGLMGGYGDARSTATSTLRLPDGATVQTHARGKVSGYSAGIYGTVYQNDVTRLGAYADTWLQYGRYHNQINSELGATRYRSSVWSASVEAGYAVKPFDDGTALGPVIIEPHVQLVYSRYDAQDATLQGTRLRSGSDNAWNSRIGARLYPQATANAPKVRPFLEANWLHGFGNPSVQMGPNTLDAALSRNTLELKLGAEGRVNRAVQVSGHVFGQAGSNNQRGYGGMVNIGYRW